MVKQRRAPGPFLRSEHIIHITISLLGVIVVIRITAAALPEEVVPRLVAGFGYASARRSQKIGTFGNGHVQIDGFKETPRDEAPAKVGKNFVIRALPLLYVKQNV